MKAKDIENKNTEELRDNLREEKVKLVQMRFEVVSRQLKNFSAVKETRRSIARIMTKLNRSKK